MTAVFGFGCLQLLLIVSWGLRRLGLARATPHKPCLYFTSLAHGE